MGLRTAKSLVIGRDRPLPLSQALKDGLDSGSQRCALATTFDVAPIYFSWFYFWPSLLLGSCLLQSHHRIL